MGAIINGLEKIKKWHPLGKKEDTSFSKRVLDANENYEKSEFVENNAKEEFNSLQKSNHHTPERQENYKMDSYEPTQPPAESYTPSDRQRYSSSAREQNYNQDPKEPIWERNGQQNPRQNNYGEQRGIPFEEPPPLSVGMDSNSPEMEKLDTVMIEIRNIKAQNIQILSELRLIQDRIRRTY